MKPEPKHNFIPSRIEFWKDHGLCDEAARTQAEHEWSEIEQQWLDDAITDLEYGR